MVGCTHGPTVPTRKERAMQPDDYRENRFPRGWEYVDTSLPIEVVVVEAVAETVKVGPITQERLTITVDRFII